MKALMHLMRETMDKAHGKEELKPFAEALAQRSAALHRTTVHLIGIAMGGETEAFLADATLYLENFGLVVIAWQWLQQGIVAQEGLENNPRQGPEWEFYQGKLDAMAYFFEYELPKTLGLEARLHSSRRVALDARPECIN